MESADVKTKNKKKGKVSVSYKPKFLLDYGAHYTESKRMSTSVAVFSATI